MAKTQTALAIFAAALLSASASSAQDNPYPKGIEPNQLGEFKVVERAPKHDVPGAPKMLYEACAKTGNPHWLDGGKNSNGWFCYGPSDDSYTGVHTAFYCKRIDFISHKQITGWFC